MHTAYPRILLAGTNSRSGKTTLTMGLILAIKKRGLKVQAFKAGPDYIDPTYHTLASGKACRNLDTWMLPKDVILELFQRQARLADISVIEGVMGLYDGLKDKEVGSSAHLAKMLKSPVILIMDAGSMSRSAAAAALGYKEFDKEVALKGVILNNIGSPSHYKSIKSSIENKTGLPVLGYLPKDKDLKLPQRHLGLIPTGEKAPLKDFSKRLLNLVEKNIDINKIIRIAKGAEALPDFKRKLFRNTNNQLVAGDCCIAVAKDAAFNFYYQDSLDLLEHYGANLIEFSPIRDKSLAQDVQGVYIGGGFPELFAQRLSKNTALKRHIYKRAKLGLPIYAECGGLMYLTKKIVDFKNKSFPMLGIFDTEVIMGNRLRALGYVDIKVARKNILSRRGKKARAHLFHWSDLNGAPKKEEFAYRLKKNKKLIPDGLLKWNCLASYAHLHFASCPEFAKNFIRSCLEYKNKENK